MKKSENDFVIYNEKTIEFTAGKHMLSYIEVEEERPHKYMYIMF